MSEIKHSESYSECLIVENMTGKQRIQAQYYDKDAIHYTLNNQQFIMRNVYLLNNCKALNYGKRNR